MKIEKSCFRKFSIFSKFITVLFILSVAYADVTVTATKNNDTDKVGYLNATNTSELIFVFF